MCEGLVEIPERLTGAAGHFREECEVNIINY